MENTLKVGDMVKVVKDGRLATIMAIEEFKCEDKLIFTLVHVKMYYSGILKSYMLEMLVPA